MLIKNLIQAIEEKHKPTGFRLNSPASISQVASFEKNIGFNLPDDFVEFYLTCNGFECSEDLFTFCSLELILKNKDFLKDKFVFAEYMIYSDTWLLHKQESKYCILNGSKPETLITNSLVEFLQAFLNGGVFEQDGLYDLQTKVQQSSERTSE